MSNFVACQVCSCAKFFAAVKFVKFLTRAGVYAASTHYTAAAPLSNFAAAERVSQLPYAAAIVRPAATLQLMQLLQLIHIREGGQPHHGIGRPEGAACVDALVR